MRLLVVTSRYPTPDRPSAGTFIRDRLADPSLSARLVAPRRYDGARWVRFLRLAVESLTARGSFDGVEVHFVLPTGPLGLLAARLRRRPLVVYAHGGDVRDAAHRSALHRWLTRLVLASADAVVVNSAATASDVRRLARRSDDPMVVPMGIDVSMFGPRPRPRQARVLYLGGNAAQKGVAVARRLATTLAGPGIRELEHDDMPALLADHDVLLVPSQVEGFGLVATEAIAAGRWVVASAVGGLLDVVTPGLNGTLVADGDFEAALSGVPDYDPAAVAATADRFDRGRTWSGMAAVWDRVLDTRRGTAPRED